MRYRFDSVTRYMIQYGEKIKAWVEGVEMDPGTFEQVSNMANLPIIHGYMAIMPDAHKGIGACVGTVIPTKGALVPAAVGVDIGCGMCYWRTAIKADALEDLPALRHSIERAVPVGSGQRGGGDFYEDRMPASHGQRWARELQPRFEKIIEKHSKVTPRTHPIRQLGTLGGGNHFIEIVRDQEGFLGIMLHSGSRGIGNRIGQYFIERARIEAEIDGIRLVDRDLAWLSEARPSFGDYIEAMLWAQDYARINRDLMMESVYAAFARHINKEWAVPVVTMKVNCHHNFTESLGDGVWLTRKGAVKAGIGDMVIIPGAMGRRSYIARGLGNAASFNSCSHGAGRVMSRGDAKRKFTKADVIEQTSTVECRKDAGIIDEIPAAYKDIDAVMAAQKDLIEPLFTLEALVCVKG